MKEISFNEKGYQKAIKNLKKCIQIINSYSEQFNEQDKIIDSELLKEIAANGIRSRKVVYTKELKNVAEYFNVEFEKICTLEYVIQNPLFSDIANSRCKLYYMFIQDIAKYLYGQSYLVDYIDILKNVATMSMDAEKELQEYYIDYTKNDKEDKILIQLNKLKSIYYELQKIGVSKNEAQNLIMNDNLEIDSKGLHLICK